MTRAALREAVVGVVRFFLGLPLLIAALFLMFAALLPTDGPSYQQSLSNQKEILADLKRIGVYTERFRSEEGRLPRQEELLGWIERQDFGSPLIDGYKEFPRPYALTIGVLPRFEELVIGHATELDPAANHSYRIALWNDWQHEYAPETGEHTLPTRIEDYSVPLWQRAALLALASGLAVLGYPIGVRHLFDKARAA